MNPKTLLVLAAIISLGLAPRPPAAIPAAIPSMGKEKLRGDYLEARTCDVFVGACFANSETSEAGKQATLAWKFTEGEWKGVPMKGAAAVLLIDARSTLGDPYHSPLPVRNVLLIDERATDDQIVALREFVALQMGELAGNIVEERLVPIELAIDCCDKEGCAKLSAGDIVKLETRCLHEDDKVCGHEDTYYQPFVGLTEKHPVYTVEHVVKRTLLDREWDDRDARSAFLGRFELRGPPAAKAVDPDEILAR
jgi:hypothetical protein